MNVAGTLGLAPTPLSNSGYWGGLARLVGLAGLANVLGLAFANNGELGTGLMLVTTPPSMWFLLGPWIIRHYANRLLALGLPPVIALIAYGLTSFCLLLGVFWLLTPFPLQQRLGLPQFEELGAVIMPLLFGWVVASLVWLVFTLTLGFAKLLVKEEKAAT